MKNEPTQGLRIRVGEKLTWQSDLPTTLILVLGVIACFLAILVLQPALLNQAGGKPFPQPTPASNPL